MVWNLLTQLEQRVCSHCVLHFSEHLFNLSNPKLPEEWSVDWSETNLDICCLKITVHARLQNFDRGLHCFFLAPLTVTLLKLLLELRDCFLILRASSDCLVADWLAWGINFVDLGSLLDIAAHQGHNHAHRPNSLVLRVLLHVGC